MDATIRQWSANVSGDGEPRTALWACFCGQVCQYALHLTAHGLINTSLTGSPPASLQQLLSAAAPQPFIPVPTLHSVPRALFTSAQVLSLRAKHTVTGLLWELKKYWTNQWWLHTVSLFACPMLSHLFEVNNVCLCSSLHLLSTAWITFPGVTVLVQRLVGHNCVKLSPTEKTELLCWSWRVKALIMNVNVLLPQSAES